MKIDIKKIQVSDRKRAISNIDGLKNSIKEIGLLNPITVNSNYELIAGLNRLEACKALNYENIECNVVNLGILQQELAQIDENIIRNELTVIERSDQLARRKEIYEQLYPETRKGQHGGGKGENTKRKSENAESAFSDDTSLKTGKSKRVIQEEVQISKKIKPSVKAQIKDTDIADNKTALLGLAKMKVEQQERVVSEAVEKGTSVKKAVLDEIKKPHVSHNSGENEWYTPSYILEAARKAMGSIDTDPASSDIANKAVKAKKYYTLEDDGLKQKWEGNVYLNPPYSQPQIADFSKLAVDKYLSGEITQACILVNNATETRWMQKVAPTSSAICWLNKRVKYLDIKGKPANAPLQGQFIIYLGKNKAKFYENFNELGYISWDEYGKNNK